MTTTQGAERVSRFEVSDRAHSKIRELLKERAAVRDDCFIRLYADGTHPTRPEFGMSFDSALPSDLVFQHQGLSFVVDPESIELLGQVHIDYLESSDRQGFVFVRSITDAVVPAGWIAARRDETPEASRELREPMARSAT